MNDAVAISFLLINKGLMLCQVARKIYGHLPRSRPLFMSRQVLLSMNTYAIIQVIEHERFSYLLINKGVMMCLLVQKNIHFLRFRVYDAKAMEYWAVLAVANFRGVNDTENMMLGKIDGPYARQKPKELLASLQGYLAISNPPTPDSILLGRGNSSTQDLLASLLATTQASSSSPRTPDSQRSTASRPTTSGKFPKSQPPAPTPIDVNSSEENNTSDEGDSTTEEEDELESTQPSPAKMKKKRKRPSGKGQHPAKAVAQQTVLEMFSGNKKPKIVHSTDGGSNIDSSTISFSSANLTLEEVSKFLEKKFTEQAAAAQSPTDGKKKGGGGLGKGGKKRELVVTGKAKGVKDKAGSSATTEQKGTPLFMSRPYCFC